MVEQCWAEIGSAPGLSFASGAPWTPASISGIVEWWDFSDTSKITASGGSVTSVATSLPSGGHALTTPGVAPTTGSDTINAKNVLTFNGTSSVLSATIASLSAPATILFVGKNTAASGAQHEAVIFSAGDGRLFMDNAGKVAIYGGTTIVSSATAWGTTNPHQVVAVLNGASSAVYVDGGTATTGSIGTKPSLATSVFLGRYFGSAIEFWQGLQGEVAIIAGSIGSGDRASWNSYCARWGL